MAVLVVALGNPLMGDDGAGPAMLELLRANPFPPGIRLAELASDALNLPRVWAGEAQVWLLDALVTGAPPGTLHRLEHEQVLALPQRHATVHHVSLPEALRWIALAHPEMRSVRYTLLGIEVARVAPGAPLSPAVADGCRRAAGILRLELAPGSPNCL